MSRSLSPDAEPTATGYHPHQAGADDSQGADAAARHLAAGADNGQERMATGHLALAPIMTV